MEYPLIIIAVYFSNCFVKCFGKCFGKCKACIKKEEYSEDEPNALPGGIVYSFDLFTEFNYE